MPHIELRKKSGVKSAGDIQVSVQDRTFEYLQNTITPEIRVSAYLDRDYAIVDQDYEEIFVDDNCRFESKIISMAAGSTKRKGIVLPGPMSNGEQLIIVVKRSSVK